MARNKVRDIVIELNDDGHDQKQKSAQHKWAMSRSFNCSRSNQEKIDYRYHYENKTDLKKRGQTLSETDFEQSYQKPKEQCSKICNANCS